VALDRSRLWRKGVVAWRGIQLRMLNRFRNLFVVSQLTVVVSIWSDEITPGRQQGGGQCYQRYRRKATEHGRAHTGHG